MQVDPEAQQVAPEYPVPPHWPYLGWHGPVVGGTEGVVVVGVVAVVVVVVVGVVGVGVEIGPVAVGIFVAHG